MFFADVAGFAVAVPWPFDGGVARRSGTGENEAAAEGPDDLGENLTPDRRAKPLSQGPVTLGTTRNHVPNARLLGMIHDRPRLPPP